MIEILDENQPWEIPLPHTWEDKERVMEARRGGTVMARWEWQLMWGHESWIDVTDPSPYLRRPSWGQIVQMCLDHGWTLHSLPTPAGPASPEHEHESDDDGGNEG